MNLKKIVILSLCSILFFVVFMSINTIGVRAQEDWSEPGDYPVSPEDPDWKELSYSEALAASNMPEDKTKKLSTEELVIWFMEYPFLGDIAAFDSLDYAMDCLKGKSNICREFLSRKDAKNVLLEYYMELDYANMDDVSKLVKETFFNAYFTYIKDELNGEDIATIKKIVEKQDSAENLALISLRLSLDGNENKPTEFNELNSYMPKATMDGFNYSGSNGYSFYDTWCKKGSYTRYGMTASGCFKYISGDISDATADAAHDYFHELHPSFGYVYPATKKYNCHSYAWIGNYPTNQYLIKSALTFSHSSQFTLVSTNGYANSGNKILICKSSVADVHSLIANSYGSGCNSISTISKYGSYGVYTALLSEALALYSEDTGASLYYKVYSQ